MNRTKHSRIIDIAELAKDDFEKATIKYIHELQFEVDDLKNILRLILTKDHPEELIKYSDILSND